MAISDRKIAAQLARDLYAEKINFEEFMREYPDFDKDDDIDELYSLIEHEPKKGGLFGIDSVQHDLYIKEIENLIEKLEKDQI